MHKHEWLETIFTEPLRNSAEYMYACCMWPSTTSGMRNGGY